MKKKNIEGKNRIIKKLLERVPKINQKRPKDHREDYKDLFGTWSEEDLKEFNNATSDSRKIDRGDWE